MGWHMTGSLLRRLVVTATALQAIVIGSWLNLIIACGVAGVQGFLLDALPPQFASTYLRPTAYTLALSGAVGVAVLAYLVVGTRLRAVSRAAGAGAALAGHPLYAVPLLVAVAVVMSAELVVGSAFASSIVYPNVLGAGGGRGSLGLMDAMAVLVVESPWAWGGLQLLAVALAAALLAVRWNAFVPAEEPVMASVRGESRRTPSVSGAGRVARSVWYSLTLGPLGLAVTQGLYLLFAGLGFYSVLGGGTLGGSREVEIVIPQGGTYVEVRRGSPVVLGMAEVGAVVSHRVEANDSRLVARVRRDIAERFVDTDTVAVVRLPPFGFGDSRVELIPGGGLTGRELGQTSGAVAGRRLGRRSGPFPIGGYVDYATVDARLFEQTSAVLDRSAELMAEVQVLSRNLSAATTPERQEELMRRLDEAVASLNEIANGGVFKVFNRPERRQKDE